MTISFLRGDPAFLDDRFPLPLDRPFATRHARREGLTPDSLTELVAMGLLRRVMRGVYVAAQVPDSRELRGRALALVAPPGSVVSDWCACWFWTGVDHPANRDAVPHLTVFRFRGHERLRNPLVVGGERWFLPRDVVPLQGQVMITSPLRTALDLGRFAPRVLAIGGMDALARSGAFRTEELGEEVERFRRQRGVVQLRHLAPLVDPRAESPGESALRLRWAETPGMPKAELQIPVRAHSGQVLYRIDLGVEELRLGAEYDGEEWHTAREDRAHDSRRRLELRVEHGWTIEVFRRHDVFGQRESVSTRMPAAVRSARLAGARPRRSAG